MSQYENPGPSTVVSLLRWRAEHQPGQLAYRFLNDGERDETRLSYGELDRAARAVAARLTEAGAAGERAVLLYPPGLDYLIAFYGCLYAGTVAVPAYPPDPARLDRSLRRLEAIVQDAQPLLTLTTAAHAGLLDLVAGRGPGPALPPVLATDGIAPGDAASWQPPAVGPGSTAFLQYTSGSTAVPRGVVLSHGNLLHNSGLIHRFFGSSDRTVAVAWLPPYHDMGLIGGIIQPLYGGFPITLMSPGHFLSRPLRWLEAVSRYGATTSGGPNFAYDLCVRKTTPAERATLDLSRWQVAFNGAEPVRPETLERFAAAFAPAGFRPDAFQPCYGLAEATLIATGGVAWTAGGTSAAARRLVSCGRTAPSQRVVVADPRTQAECAAGQEGEIWLTGPSVAQGYWSRPELSREVFGARLTGSGEGPFLRTGDLGLIRDGELYVTGRLKDLIVIRGRNHHPQDIEATAERSHPALRPGCGAAFTVAAGDPDGPVGAEQLVVAWELSPQAGEAHHGEVATAVRTAVAREHGLQVRTIVLLPRGGIPKTSSGKVQRGQCASLYAGGQLGGQRCDLPGPDLGAGRLDRAALRSAAPAQRRAQLTDYLCRQIATACGVAPDEVDPGRPLLALGADSIAVIAVGQAVEQDTGVTLPLSDLAGDGTVTDIAGRLAGELTAGTTDSAPQPAAAITETALSHQQRTLWFLHQMSPGSAEHNVAAALRLLGPLDVTALRGALDLLTGRHAVLRTTFGSRDGEPVACVAASGRACLREHDGAIRPVHPDHLRDTASEAFDLATGPLLRVDLWRPGPAEAVLLVVAHHIITDFWSMTTLVSELETAYAAIRDGHTDPAAALPPPAVPYAEVVAWQDRTLTGLRGQDLRAYWDEELRGAPSELRLPRRETGGRAGAAAQACQLRIGPELTRQIGARARAENVTPYMLLLAGFQLLLHRYTGQHDLLVGTPMTGRGRPGFERVVGYCMNPVAIRGRLDGGESVRDVLSRVRRRVAGALDHQTFPIHLAAGDRDPGAPLFDALFVFNRPPEPGAGELALLSIAPPGLRRPFADLTAEPVPVEPRESPVDLHLTMAEIDGTLVASFRYRTSLLDSDTAARMLRHFENILAAMAVDADQPASTVAMLGPGERQSILACARGAQPARPRGETVVQLIERQAAATPDAIAVTGETGELSYRQLDERAGALGRRLTASGAGPGARIGLCLERSPDMIVALLAALKSGAAYVPADPAAPPDRVAAMFTAAGVSVVLSQRALAGRLPAGPGVILLDDDPAAGPAARAGAGTARPPITGGSPVYVIYTSGSTGTPKGVVVSHRALANYVQFAAARFAMAPGDRVLQFAGLSFDASAQQIFAALITGATLVLRNDRMLSTPRSFLDQCAQWSVTVLDLPTAYWHELVVGITQAGATLPPTLRLVIIGGERAVPELVLAWCQETGPRVRLINNYGPTEATIVAVTGDLTGYSGTGEVPIGRPVAGVAAYVLDPMRQPVPPGVTGELYLGGAGLADGYLGQPGLTARAFVPDPFEPGRRLYRTGDLASFTPGGELVFRGRADRQIKLRGYRVEPAEIESALRAVPGIADALVVLRPRPRQLIGYLVSAGGPAPEAVTLRAALRRTLPEYMVPSAFVTVPAFPLNHHGKVDVAALPVPGTARPDERNRPRTPAEHYLASTFASVLGVPAVGVDDDFFGLGGQSLLATKVLARIRDHFGVELPLRVVFETPTAGGLAALITRDAADRPGSPSLAPLRPVPRDQPLPLSFVQEGIWFLQLLAPESTAYNVPRALRIHGDLDTGLVAATFAALERRHEILRTTFPDDDGKPVQVVHPPRGIPVVRTDLADLPAPAREDRIQQLILALGQTPFDMASGPLIRVNLVRCGSSEHVLIVVEHHLIHDGWAQGVFLRDFLELYDALAAGRPPRLPELAVQYADYAHWQRQQISGAVLDTLTSFWTAELAGAPHLLALPTDRPHPSAVRFSGDQEVLEIDVALGRALRQFGLDHGATLFMTMFSAFATLLYRYSGQDDILIGVGVANRQRPEQEDLLGMMINTMLVRARMPGNPSFAQLLDGVRERCLRAYAHQDMPFGKLVEALNPKRNLSHMPLCQVLFTFLDTPMPRLAVAGLKFEVVPVHNKTAKFDLNVVVQPGADDDGITVLMEYNADVFEAATARRMLGHFHAILAAALARPDQPLDRFLPDLAPARAPSGPGQCLVHHPRPASAV